MWYQDMPVTNCQSSAEIRATYQAARRRLTEVGQGVGREIAPAPPPISEPPVLIKTCGTATGSMRLGVDPENFRPAHIRGSDIIRAVLKVTQVRRNEFMSPRRSRSVVEARQLAYFFMRHFTPLSLPQIGKLVGGKDHSTVMHGIRRVATEPEVFGARAANVAQELGVRLQETA